MAGFELHAVALALLFRASARPRLRAADGDRFGRATTFMVSHSPWELEAIVSVSSDFCPAMEMTNVREYWPSLVSVYSRRATSDSRTKSLKTALSAKPGDRQGADRRGRGFLLGRCGLLCSEAGERREQDDGQGGPFYGFMMALLSGAQSKALPL